MPGVVLGKRARNVLEGADLVPQTPSKRGLRNTKAAIYNDENQDPDVLAEDEDDVLTELPRKKLKTVSPFKPVTPSTPRHRDVFSSPTTPRHVVMSAGKLFKRATPSTPVTPSTPSSIQTIYHGARQLFTRSTEPGQLIGREAERQQLTTFLERCSPAAAAPGGCLYVSGPPGTGKSAMVGEMTRALAEVEGVRSAYINCMSIKSTQDLYSTLLEALGQDGSMTEADAVSTLQSLFCPRKEMSSQVYLVTLDEIDHILTMGLESLYRVFEWSLAKSSRLVLVGIANALDLTDRFLPRLKSKNLKPDLLPFLPYNAGQIKKIIMGRLMSLMPEGSSGHVPFIHPAAIDLCSRKVASQTGDLRKAFGICRRALDLIEQETRSKHEDEAREQLLQMTPSKRPLGEKVNNASAGGGRGGKSVVQLMSQSLKALTPQTAPRASIGHLNKVTAEVFGNGTSQRLKALNLQQKAALCSLVAYENRARASIKAGDAASVSKTQTLAPSIRILFNTYCRLCTRDSVLHPLSSSEFREVVGSLETLGLVNAVDGKIGSFSTPQTPSKRGRKSTVASGDDKRVSSATGERDMESMTDGIGAGILQSILSGEALD